MDSWGTRLWCNTILDFFEIKSFPVGSHLAGDVRGVSQGARGEVGRALSRGTTATSAAASTRGNCLQGTVVSWYRHCSTRTLRPTCTLCSVDVLEYPFKVPFQARGVHGFSSTKYHGVPGIMLALNPGFLFRILSRFGEKDARQNPDRKPGFEASTMLGCPKEGETMDP